MNNTHIALLGCNALVREGLRRILEEKAFKVVQSSDTPSDLLDLSLKQDGCPLIVLVDQRSPEYGLDEICQIMSKIPKAKLVYLADKFDLNAMILAFRSGAQGYIIKDIRCESLIGSLQLIALGEKILPGELIDQLPGGAHAHEFSAAAQPDLHDILSAREIAILQNLVAGFSNKMIARQLDLGEASVKVHVKGILRKLNVNNRTQAAVLGFNSGLGLALQDGNPAEGAVIQNVYGPTQLADAA